MRVDAASSKDDRTARTIEQVLGWLVAVVPAVVGVATIEMPEAERAPHAVTTASAPPTSMPATQLAATPPSVHARD